MGRDLEAALARLKERPQSVTFEELRRLCELHFGRPRQHGSHVVFRTGLAEHPLVTIQPHGKMAKAYQCRQAFAAITALLRKRREQKS